MRSHGGRPTELERALSALERALRSEGPVLVAEARVSLAQRYEHHLRSPCGGLFVAEMFACSERLRYAAVIDEEHGLELLWLEE